MSLKRRFLYLFLVLCGISFVVVLFLYGFSGEVVQAKGMIGMKERDLLFTATFIMFIIVVPVSILTLVIAWKYREGNKKAKRYCTTKAVSSAKSPSVTPMKRKVFSM